LKKTASEEVERSHPKHQESASTPPTSDSQLPEPTLPAHKQDKN